MNWLHVKLLHISFDPLLNSQYISGQLTLRKTGIAPECCRMRLILNAVVSEAGVSSFMTTFPRCNAFWKPQLSCLGEMCLLAMMILCNYCCVLTSLFLSPSLSICLVSLLHRNCSVAKMKWHFNISFGQYSACDLVLTRFWYAHIFLFPFVFWGNDCCAAADR